MKIWLISIFEQTPLDNVFSTRFISIAEEATARGHELSFFASTFKHNTKVQRFPDTHEEMIKPNYRMVYFRSRAYGKNVSLKRLMAHYEFSAELVKFLDKQERPDIILMAYPPISMSYEVVNWANAKGIPVCIDIIDPWPDVFEKALPTQLSFLKGVLFGRMNRMARKAFQGATHITAISRQYIDWVMKRIPEKKPASVFYPAVDLGKIQSEIKAAKAESGDAEDDGTLQVIYAGSLASSYDIPCILEAAGILEQKYPDRIRFLIAGVGPQQGLIESYASRHKNLRYLGRLTKPELMKAYATCDLGMTQHVRGATQSVTYKLFDLLASELPILNSLESEMNAIIVDNRVGLFNAPGDAKTLAENIERFHLDRSLLKEYKVNALELTARLGDCKLVFSDFVDLLEQVADKKAKQER